MKKHLKSVDDQYLDLLRLIQDEGSLKGDRTGTGTTSIFGHFMKIDLNQGFPLLTSKEMSIKNITTELLWFMRGQTSIRPLLRDKNYIWVGDAYKRYVKSVLELERLGQNDLANYWLRKNNDDTLSLFTRKEFIQELLNNDEFHEIFGDLGPIYGEKWRNFGGIDQLQEVVDKLINNPNDRRMIVSAWDPASIHDAVLPPCHILYQFYSRELDVTERYEWCLANDIDLMEFEDGHMSIEECMNEREVPARTLSLQWYQRSCDTSLGIPYNIASYAELTHIIAKMTNHAVDTLSCALGDTHIYNNHYEGVAIQLSQETHPLPTISFDSEIKWSTNVDDVLAQMTHESIILHDYVSSTKVDYPLSN